MPVHQVPEDGRLDLYVYNEATAWTLSSRKLIEDCPVSEDESWDAATSGGRLMAQTLYQDDAFHARIVLGELSEEEQHEWLGRASWWLQIPDGVLVLAAGGEFSWGWTEDFEEDEFVHQVAVPPGRYRVDIYTTLTGVNGLWALERAGQKEALGTWWRRTRPDEPMPAWLQFLLLENLATDPGHASEWDGWSSARHHALMDTVEKGAWIDWIVQLRPLQGEPPKKLPELDEGCFTEPELRIPERCPRGIAGNPVNGEEFDDEPPPEPVNVIERVLDCVPEPLSGGPVELAAEEIEVAARLGWFANRDVDGELLFEGPELGYWAEEHVPADDCFLRTATDGRFRIGFSESESVDDLLHRLHRLGPACAALPDGTSLELVMAGADEKIGSVRLVGLFQQGSWQIEQAWPVTDASTLRAALELAREADGPTVQALDPVELQGIRERWRDEGMQRVAPLVIDGLSIGHDEGGRFTYLIAATVFAVRFGHTWPCAQPEDPLAEVDLDDDSDHFEILAELGLPSTEPLLKAESGRDYFDLPEDDIPGEVSHATESLMHDFLAAGALHVGDLACSFSPGILIRGMADKKARWYGTIMVAPFVGTITEAYTRFEDGSSLTSTTNPFPGGSVEGSVIAWNLLAAETSPKNLIASHLEAIRLHAEKHRTEAVLIRQNLLGLCEAIEEFLVRRTG